MQQSLSNIISISVEMKAVAAAVISVLAAVVSQLGYNAGERAERPTHFGGAPIITPRSEDSIHAEGTRERAGRQSAFYQSAATSLLVMASLLQLSTIYTAKTAGAVIFFGLVVAFSLLSVRLLRWRREDRRIFAKTKYYMFHIPREHLDSEEVQRLFAEQHSKLIPWL